MVPLVSIICTTYNHEQYIKQALEGFIMQQCNFPVEVIVHDDASTDNTAEIIRAYAKKYPDLIRPILQTENQYSKGFDIWGYLFTKEAKGKYIALCEGDDYWTDPLKLQKQVDFLEKNEDCGLCFHNADILNIDKNIKKTKFKIPKNKLVFGTKEIFRLPWFVPTASIVFRTSLLPEESPLWVKKSKSGDMALQLMISKKGYLYYLPYNMSVYRLGTPYSITIQNKKNPLNSLRNYIKMLEISNKEYFNNKYIWDFRYRKFIYTLSVIKYYFIKIWKYL